MRNTNWLQIPVHEKCGSTSTSLESRHNPSFCLISTRNWFAMDNWCMGHLINEDDLSIFSLNDEETLLASMDPEDQGQRSIKSDPVQFPDAHNNATTTDEFDDDWSISSDAIFLQTTIFQQSKQWSSSLAELCCDLLERERLFPRMSILIWDGEVMDFQKRRTSETVYPGARRWLCSRPIVHTARSQATFYEHHRGGEDTNPNKAKRNWLRLSCSIDIFILEQK